jgi:hypothetical protein
MWRRVGLVRMIQFLQETQGVTTQKTEFFSHGDENMKSYSYIFNYSKLF